MEIKGKKISASTVGIAALSIFSAFNLTALGRSVYGPGFSEQLSPDVTTNTILGSAIFLGVALSTAAGVSAYLQYKEENNTPFPPHDAV